MSSSQRRSIADYRNVQPRVDCRWLDGTPKLRRSAADLPGDNARQSTKSRRYHKRRSSESDLRNIRPRPRIRVQSPSSASENEESDTGSDQLYATAEGSAEEVADAEENVSMSSATSIETVSGHFRTLFRKLEDYLKTTEDEKESLMIRKRMNKMKDSMSIINQMFDDLLTDGDRLEEHLLDRQNNNA